MRRSQLILVYSASLLIAIGLFFLICSAGLKLASLQTAIPSATGLLVSQPETPNIFLHVLVALTVIVIGARLLATLFRWLRQPLVMGEVVAGLLLGPSFLGWLAPQAYAQLLPAGIASYLAVIAQVGIILFMFLVGLDLDTGLLRRSYGLRPYLCLCPEVRLVRGTRRTPGA
jgi:prolipoprotein diacylglyceryltransferase